MFKNEDGESITYTEWLKERQDGIGGSDVAGICGKSPFETPYTIYLNKTSSVNSEDDLTNEPMYWGTRLEDLIAKEWAGKNKKSIRRIHRIIKHPKYSMLFANIDRAVNKEKAILEIKTSGSYNRSKWDQGVPEMYNLQVQHYMSVLSYKKAYVAVLIGGNQYRQFEVDRDDALIEEITTKCIDFWINHVQKRIPPEPIEQDVDSQLIYQIYDHSEPCFDIEDQSVQPLCDQYNELKLKEKDISSQVKSAKNKLVLALGNHQSGVCGDFRLSIGKRRTSRFNAKKFQVDHQKLYDQYKEDSSYSVFALKKLGEGVIEG